MVGPADASGRSLLFGEPDFDGPVSQPGSDLTVDAQSAQCGQGVGADIAPGHASALLALGDKLVVGFDTTKGTALSK